MFALYLERDSQYQGFNRRDMTVVFHFQANYPAGEETTIAVGPSDLDGDRHGTHILRIHRTEQESRKGKGRSEHPRFER